MCRNVNGMLVNVSKQEILLLVIRGTSTAPFVTFTSFQYSYFCMWLLSDDVRLGPCSHNNLTAVTILRMKFTYTKKTENYRIKHIINVQ
jgi:hypothetical protein